MKKRIAIAFALALIAPMVPSLWWRSWEFNRTIDIAAPAPRIWSLLSDFDGYRRWNSYNPKASGTLAVGSVVRVEARLGADTHVVDNVITEVVPEQRLCWRSKNWYGFLVAGTRCRTLEQRGTATTYRHHEIFEGPLAWLIERIMRPRIERGLDTHDADLKRAAERSGES
jgi:hypothetical protein